MFFLLLVLAAPVPKQPPLVPLAPPPRLVSVWVDVDGTRRNYTREYWDRDGILRRRIYEGDPELERAFPTLPAGPGIVPEN